MSARTAGERLPQAGATRNRNRNRSRTARTLAGTVAALSLCSGLVVAGAGSAAAVTGFHTSGSGVRVRSAANTESSQISTIPATGTALDIACQVAGETVTATQFGTSSVWDLLSGYGGYISDLFVQETPYGQFDPAIPQCGAPAPAPSTREQLAATWAASEVGRSRDDYGRVTAGWCARWAVGAYGRANAGYSTAIAMFSGFQAMGLTHGGSAPAGTFVFFAAAPVNGNAGHVAISDGAGGMYTTSSTVIQHRLLSYAGATYLGWSYAPAGWSR